MADDVVRGADEFGFAVATDLDKVVVAVFDDAFGVIFLSKFCTISASSLDFKFSNKTLYPSSPFTLEDEL
jgi:hypothetical protein